MKVEHKNLKLQFGLSNVFAAESWKLCKENGSQSL